VSPLQLVGFAAALAGVALASFEREEAGPMRMVAGVPWALAAVLGFGGYYVPMHEASEQDFLWAAFVFRSSAALLVLAAWVVLRPRLQAARGSLAAIALIGVADTAGNSLFAAASSLGEVSVVSVLATLYPVTTILLAAIVLSERVGRLQQLGIAAALTGVVLISAG
jgi:drug/metabolite transporter (DMT)-like permease